MLFAIGFLVTFLLGGLTGVILASPPLDFHVTDSYFVVAHFHYVLFGTVVFAMFAGFYFWWPKMTGRMLDDRLGKMHFWLLFIGFHATFLVQHWLGARGHARAATPTTAPADGFTDAQHVLHGRRVPARRLHAAVPLQRLEDRAGRRRRSTVDDPWGFGSSLEWATSCPPPRHNFTACRASAPSARPSTCTTRTCPTGAKRSSPDRILSSLDRLRRSDPDQDPAA